MRVVWADSHKKKALLSEFISYRVWPGRPSREFGQCQAFAVVDGGEVVAAVVYNNWDPDAGVIEISAASKNRRWLTRPVLKALFEYPFIECQCQAVVLRVADDNTHMHRIAKAYGFEHYIIPRLRGRDANENVFVLSDDAWKSNRFNRKTEVH